MRILDLFCGAGLVADGLKAAGWEVVGVDIEPQPRYEGAFLQLDATALDQRFIQSFDAIWASPPCLRDTALKHAPGAKGDQHPDLITPTRRMLQASGLPYVIENVETAALIDPVTLCGSMFGLGVEDNGRRFHLERHRKFETNWGLTQPWHPPHPKPCVGVYGGHARVRAASAGGRGTKEPRSRSGAEIMREAMGIGRFMSVAEISQGIPPIYAQHIGEALLAHLQQQPQELAA